jgi:hypothetical protein
MTYGANIENVEIYRNTLLMAINLRQVTSVQALFSCGTSIRVKDLRSNTPLHQAAKRKVFHLKHKPDIILLDAKI